MAKTLFLGLPLHGHVNPSLPLVTDLVTRGDQVISYASDQFTARIEQAGQPFPDDVSIGTAIPSRAWRSFRVDAISIESLEGTK